MQMQESAQCITPEGTVVLVKNVRPQSNLKVHLDLRKVINFWRSTVGTPGLKKDTNTRFRTPRNLKIQ